MKRNNPIRTLARSHKYQTLYNRAKDLDLKLFNNNKDLSRIQTIFLDYLELYSSLYQDIAMNEDCINYDKLKDDMLIDAYLVYRKRKRNNKDKKKKKDNNTGTPSIVFTKGANKKVKK